MDATDPDKAEQVPARDPRPTPGSAESARPAAIDPQLFMAARQGDSRQLKGLLTPKDDGVQKDTPQEVVVEVDGPAPLDGVTNGGDSLLHVVAAHGDGKGFLDCAKMIISDKKSGKRLLVARNNRGDTPLHCAARAGNGKMMSCLISSVDETAAKEFVRKQNECGETALHHAVRAAHKDTVDKLLSVDSELACIPDGKGVSPLYLAISLGEVDITRRLLNATDLKLTYSGPDGRNVLHAAVSQDQAVPKLFELLKYRTSDVQEDGGQRSVPLLSQLTKQQDKKGNTPLHLAASLEGWPSGVFISRWVRHFWPGTKSTITMLLDANTYPVYLPDNEGMYPIHVAAWAGSLETVKVLLQRCPDCVDLRDGKERTFLHVAVELERYEVVKEACQRLESLSILNAQDKNGDTALHRAVYVGNLAVFNCLLRNPHVRLDVPNKKDLRPRDLSLTMIPPMFYYKFNPRSVITQSLILVGAPCGEIRPDHFHDEHTTPIDEEKESENLMNATQVMGIVAVLVATVTFASAFTLPGGYYQSADNGIPGTPVLAGNFAFDAFVLADTLAFVCSCLATFSLVFAGVPAMDLSVRRRHSNISYGLLQNSGRSLVAAFALGLYVVMAPVAHIMAIAVLLIGFVCLLYGNMEAWHLIRMANTARGRFGCPPSAAWTYVLSFFQFVLGHFWSFIIIFGIPAAKELARTVHGGRGN